MRAINTKPIRKTLFFLIYHIFLINPKNFSNNVYTNKLSLTRGLPRRNTPTCCDLLYIPCANSNGVYSLSEGTTGRDTVKVVPFSSLSSFSDTVSKVISPPYLVTIPKQTE